MFTPALSDKIFPRISMCYRLLLKKCQKWKERIENTKMAKFKFIRVCTYEIVVEGQGLALQQLFPYKSSYSFKNSDCHKFSLFDDGYIKLGHSVSRIR